MRPRFVSEAIVCLLLAIAAAAASNALAGPGRKLRWVAAQGQSSGRPEAGHARTTPPAGGAAGAPPGASPSFQPHPDKAWVEISGDEAAALFSGKSAPFLDARRTSVYEQGHIAGARPFSVWEADIDDKVKAFFQEGQNQSAPVVVYCSGGECEDSHMLAERLHQFGFNNALVYAGGFPDWEKRGLPVEKGPAR